MSLMFTSSVLYSEYLLFKESASALAVSMEVRHGIFLSTVFLLILTLSRVGILPFEDVEIT